MSGLLPNALVAADNPLVFLERIPDDSAAIVYLDPPQSYGYDEARAEQLSKVLQQARRILRTNGNLFFYLTSSAVIEARFLIRQVLGGHGQSSEYLLQGAAAHTSNTRRGGGRDVVLHYPMSEESIYNRQTKPIPDKRKARYQLEDEQGKYLTQDLTAPFDRPNLQCQFRDYQLPDGRSWRFSREAMEELADQGQIDFSGSGLPRLKRYLSEAKPTPVGLDWTDLTSSRAKIQDPEVGELLSFESPGLVERVILTGSDEDDTVVAPYGDFGLFALTAHRLSRKWIAHTGNEGLPIVKRRIQREVNESDYVVHSEDELLRKPSLGSYDEMALTYRDVAELREERDRLQRTVEEVVATVERVRTRLAETGADDDQILAALEAVTDSISEGADESDIYEEYVRRVRSWMRQWDLLHEATQQFLPSGEYVLDFLPDTENTDYSPFIIQYCRALENELLQKLFIAYSFTFKDRFDDPSGVVESDLSDKKVEGKAGRFIRRVAKGDNTFTLGEMHWILQLVKPGGNTLSRSEVLQDFAEFIEEYFDERVRASEYLSQIQKINEDYRRKAAHPHLLDLQVARECQTAVRQCLNDFILSYHSGG